MLAFVLGFVVTPALADPGDSIRLSAGGVMNSGRTIYIDLVNGHLSSIYSARGFSGGGFATKQNGRMGSLTTNDLEKLKQAVRFAVAQGLETSSCAEEDKVARAQHVNPPLPPPISDSIVSLSIAIDGRFVDTPRQGCWSSALDNLWRTIAEAADHDELSPLKGDF